MKRAFLALALLAFAATAAIAEEAVWTIDPSHSTAEFTVRHMMVAKVRGRFGTLSGTVTGDLARPETATIDVTIDAASIDTRNANRDKHLRSADFFEVETHPTITFRSTKIEKAGNGYRATGDLTMHGVTREVQLAIEGPVAPIKVGKTMRSGASATTKINRSDYGLTWNRALETGGVTVSDEVDIAIEVELIRRLEE